MANELIFLFYAALIAIGLGFFFKFFVKPKIETIYEQNRRDLILGILRRIYQSDRQMANIFEILRRQPGFQSNQTMALQFSQRDLTLITNVYSVMINAVFDELRKFNETLHWRTHLRDREFDSILQYSNFSHQFLHRLLQAPHIYDTLPLEARKQFSFQMIQNFDNLLYDKWRPIDNQIPSLLSIFEHS